MDLSGNKAAVAIIVVAALAVLSWLAFGFFGIQAAFIDETVDEEGPVFASGAGAEPPDSPEFESAMDEAAESTTEVDEETMPGEIMTLLSGRFSTASGRYTVNGDALVLNDGSDQRFLRFENFESSNGPDLNVYLRADDGDFVDLGDLKGNIGDQNYEIPVDVDLDRYDTVQIWCVRFGVLFGDAVLT